MSILFVGYDLKCHAYRHLISGFEETKKEQWQEKLNQLKGIFEQLGKVDGAWDEVGASCGYKRQYSDELCSDFSFILGAGP